MKAQTALCFVQCLEILEICQGHLSKIIVDVHPAHTAVMCNVGKQLNCVSSTLKTMLKSGKQKQLSDKGITIIVVDRKCCQKVGLAENMMHNLKQSLNHLFPLCQTSHDLFDFSHKLALIENFLNSHLTFAQDNKFFFPNMFCMAMLQ